MTGHDTLERELVAWFDDVAAPRTPDYTDAIVQSTAGRRQRPRWTFLERWLPMTQLTLLPVPTRRFPWRSVGLVAVITALLLTLLVVTIGSQHRNPAPFGLAGNGLMSYATDGDIWVVDPTTGTRRAIVTGPEVDRDPRWSRDGTRIAFIRDSGIGTQVVIVATDGRRPSIVSSEPLMSPDDDGLAWAPDGHALVVPTSTGIGQALSLIDATNGQVTDLPVPFLQLEAFWRPPDGRELLFVSGSHANRTVSLYALATGALREVPLPPGPDEEIRPMGWTPDGRRFLINRLPDEGSGMRTWVIDPETGDAVVLDVGYGHVSNAGDRVAGLQQAAAGEVVCVVDIDGGPCVPLGTPEDAPYGTHAEGLQWSPDDRWVVVEPESGEPPMLLDPLSGGTAPGAGWAGGGAESWQRLAP